MIRVLAYFIPLKSLNIKDYETATITKVIYSYETSHWNLCLKNMTPMRKGYNIKVQVWSDSLAN